LPHPDDGRPTGLQRAGAGRELVGRIEARLAQLRRDLLEGVSEADLATAVGLLDLLSQRIAERRNPS